MVLTMKKPSLKYVPLAIFQIVILVLYFVFVKHGEDTIATRGFEDIHVMIFIGFGFLMTFLKKYCYSALGFNWLLAAIVVQWAMLCQNFFHMQKGIILINKQSMVEADIMAATVLITMGALLGVASGLQLFFIAIIETVIACVNLYLVSHVFMAADTGGSIAIHTFGAYFGLGCSLAMKDKKSTAEADQQTNSESNSQGKLDSPTYTSDVTAMIGSIFLWIYWPSFNSAFEQTIGGQQRAIMNTYLSLASATVITFFMSSLFSHKEGKLDMVHIQNSTLAGGVAVGAVCNMRVSPGGAIAIGLVAGVISVLGYRFLTPKLAKIGIKDTCGVNNLHGMPGILSGVLSILFAAMATEKSYLLELDYIFPAMVIGPKITKPRSAGSQALYQLIALVVTLALSFVSGLATGFLLKLPFCKPLEEDKRYSDEVEWELPEGADKIV